MFFGRFEEDVVFIVFETPTESGYAMGLGVPWVTFSLMWRVVGLGFYPEERERGISITLESMR